MNAKEHKDTDDLIEQLGAPSRGPITTSDVSGVPEGKLTAWELTRMDGQSYYSPTYDDAPLPHQLERIQDEQQARALAVPILLRLFGLQYESAGLLPAGTTTRTFKPLQRRGNVD